MTNQVQSSVDQLLLEQGEYSPLDFLLQEGRLHYADYEAWRNNEIKYLDTALFGDAEQITALLTQAKNYLQRLGLQSQSAQYHTWHQQSPQSLRFSQNPSLDECFHQHFRKAQDQPQLDLFMDAPANSLVNGIQQALVNRHQTEARRQLERLYDTAPDHAKLAGLEQLVSAVENLSTPVNDIASEMKTLQEQLTPLAETLVGKDSHNILVPQWQRLSESLQHEPYNNDTPMLHNSYTAMQAMDWNRVRETVEQVPNWQSNLTLLHRHARACGRLQLNHAALMSWFLLCWLFPDNVDALASDIDTDISCYWSDFLEIEPELPPQTFPAWLLIRNAGLVNILPAPEDCTAIPCSAAYHTLYSLQTDKHQPNQKTDDINKRALLKQQDPALFQHYLRLV